MATKAPQTRRMTDDETRNISVDFVGKLDDGELLTGTPTVTQDDGGSELTISGQQTNSAEITVNGRTVAIGEAVQFTVTASSTGTFEILVVCDTDASQTISGLVTLVVE